MHEKKYVKKKKKKKKLDINSDKDKLVCNRVCVMWFSAVYE